MLPRLPPALPALPHPLSNSYPPWSPMPSGMDPCDYRAFYPYTPNEVKHRKRTTSAQLKVLEEIFKRDTKPNAALRTDLAVQLNMTPRGVQVWFQNRRAKEKSKAVKSLNKASGALPRKEGESPSPRSSEDLDGSESSPSEVAVDPSTSSSPSPTITSPPQLHVLTDSSDSSWQGSPVTDTPEDASFDLPSHMSRRGSLPVNSLNYGPPLVDPLDPLARRRSVDASLVRLASNPYAHIVRAKNNVLATQRLSQGRQMSRGYMNRPGLAHRSTMPIQPHTRHASMESRGYNHMSTSPSPSPLSPFHSIRASLPDGQLYPVSSRAVTAPIPGPLPNPGYSFGVASTSDSERSSPVDFSGFSFPRDDATSEDDSSASYPMSRFSSIASESSATSAYFSDVGSAGEAPDYRSMRRESCPAPGYLDLGMSHLDMGPRRASVAEGLLGHYAPSDGFEQDGQATLGYPSPSSTVSAGSSPHLAGNGTASGSELSFALHSKPEAEMNTNDAGHNSTFFFDQTYPQSAPPTSELQFNYDSFTYSSAAQPQSAGPFQSTGFGQQESFYQSHGGDGSFVYS